MFWAAMAGITWPASCSIALVGIASIQLTYRYLNLGLGIRHVFMSSDGENGINYAMTNLVLLVFMRIAIAIGKGRMLLDPVVGCVAWVSSISLPVAQFVTIMIIVVFLRSADIHGVYRPTIWMRIAVLLVCIAICVPEIVFSSIYAGPSVLTAGGIPMDPTDHTIFSCFG